MSAVFLPNELRHIGSIAAILFWISVCIGSAAGPAVAWDLTLAWDPNTEPALDGYTVYYSKHSPGPPYEYAGDLPVSELPNPGEPLVTLTSLDEHVTYYFALTAYDSSGHESAFSQQVCVRYDDAIVECGAASSGAGVSSGGGSGGCFIHAAAGRDPDAVPQAAPLAPALVACAFACLFQAFFPRRNPLHRLLHHE